MSIFDKDNNEYIKIHYSRKDAIYAKWSIWLWAYPDGLGQEYEFNGVDEFGVFAYYPLKNFSKNKFNKLGIIIKSKGNWLEKESDFDRVIILNKFMLDENNVRNVYIVDKDKQIYTNKELIVSDEIKVSRFLDFNHVEIMSNKEMKLFRIFENGRKIDECNCDGQKRIVYRIKEPFKASFEFAYKIEVLFKKTNNLLDNPIHLSELYRTPSFNEQYSYSGKLGAIYTKEKTTFRVWSPVSRKIILKIYECGTPSFVSRRKGNDKTLYEVSMDRKEQGVFETTIAGNLEGKYYTYEVYNATYNKKEIVDPYAFSTGVNGQRGMIVDFSKTNPFGFETMKIHPINFNNLVVYETHIADITSSKTWTKNIKIRKLEKTFIGASLSGTKYKENGISVSTGFDHIKELGVNAVQFLPIFDQANDEIHTSFNWGYNPANYNTLEGSYSTNPFDGYCRIIEFKKLVKAYHDGGMNIIMDVVFNHMNGAIGSNFDVLMPGYYFRYNKDGNLSNGSGCGNETASEMPMMRKFIIDSVSFWAKEYKLGGFRFDLMGIHDIETMNQVVLALKNIDPNIIVYGEPWCGGCIALPYELSCAQGNINRFNGFGAFNDKIRDALVRGDNSKGFAASYLGMPNNNDLSIVLSTIKGQINVGEICYDASKLVNYVSCHDNYTLFDRIKSSGETDYATIRKIALFANSLIFTSNGISLMLAGEEFLRTKQGNYNSYNAPYYINELDYSLKIKNIEMFKSYQKLIEFKKNVKEIVLNDNIDSSKGNIIVYEAKNDNDNFVIYHTTGLKSDKNLINLKDMKFYLSTFKYRKSIAEYIELEPFETLIVVK